MGQTIACANQKGGVGKTTTVVNLASYLALAGERVLVVDLDPQGNATSGLGLDRNSIDRSVYDAVIDGVRLGDLIVTGPIDGLDVDPVGDRARRRRGRTRAGRGARTAPSAGFSAEVADRYDYILIDCPPSLGLLTVNALTAADSVLIPLQCEYYALEGLTQLLATIDLVRDHLNPALAIKGVVLTMFDARTKLSADVAAEVRRHLGDRVFDTVIPRSVRLSEAPSHGLPITLYCPGLAPARWHTPHLAAELRTARPAGSSNAAQARRTAMPGGRHDGPSGTRPRASDAASPRSSRSAARASPAPSRSPIARIRPNPHQPRKRFDADELASLTASIAEHGVLQPILVTETIDGYQLVAGERRLRAAQAAGLERIPAVVRQLADREQLELALVENLQREDLDPIETAEAYRQLIDEFGFTQEEVATRVGRARSTVANTLRLLDLAPGVQAAVADGRLTEGHARALGGLAVELQDRVLDRSSGQELSVRQTEELVRRLREPKPEAAGRTSRRRTDPDLERVEEDLRRSLGHQGQPRPLAARRPDRHRVLQRRRTRAALRAPDRRDRVTEEATRSTASRRHERPTAKRAKAGGIRLHGRQHPGPRGPRGRPQAARHVHRLDRRPRPASPRLGGRRQLDRRGDGRPGDDHPRDDRDRRHGHRVRRRPRRPGRQAFDRQGRPRGRPHRAPRRRQVRRRRLQGLRRPPRRRRQRRQRAVGVDARRVGPRWLDLGAGVRPRQADRAGQEDRPAGRPPRHDDQLHAPTPRCSRRPSTRSRRSASASASRPT